MIRKVLRFFIYIGLSSCILFSGSLFAAKLECVKEFEKSIPVDQDFMFDLENLVGSLVVQKSLDNAVNVSVKVYASDKEKITAKELGQLVKVRLNGDQKKVNLQVEYPLSEYLTYYYPSRKGLVSWFGSYTSAVRYQGKQVSVQNALSESAVCLYADIRVKLPPNGKISLKNFFGSLQLEGIAGKTVVESAFASSSINGGEGTCTVVAGSGNVSIDAYQGDMHLETGSGKLEMKSCHGNANLQAGSGAILVESSDLQNCALETGSGTISVQKSQANFSAVTGSGKIYIVECKSLQEVKVNSGSGYVRIDGDFSQVTKLNVQTGSGNIDFTSNPFPLIDIEATSSSGKTQILVPGMAVTDINPRSRLGTFKGKSIQGKGVFVTGSGNIRVTSPVQ